MDDVWYLPGTLYSRTLDAWLHAMHGNRQALTSVFAKNGYKNPNYEFQKVSYISVLFKVFPGVEAVTQAKYIMHRFSSVLSKSVANVLHHE